MKKLYRKLTAVLAPVLLLSGLPARMEATGTEPVAQPLSAAAVSAEGLANCPQGYEPAAESARQVLYVDTKNGYFANYDKVTGQLWRSCPEGTEDDPLAGTAEQSRMRSQLFLEYYDEDGKAATFNSYEHCVSQGTLACYAAENGVEFVYTLTNYSRTLADIPEFISVERFEQYFLASATEEEKNLLNKRFVLNEDKTVYKRYAIPQFELKKVFAIMDRTGYDSAQLEIDRGENADLWQSQEEIKTRISFTLSVIVALDGDDVVVSLPADKVEKAGRSHIHTVRLNEYYGAGHADEDGYLFVPDGSGALLNFNNEKAEEGEVTVPVYGSDYTQPLSSLVLETQQAHLPIFGIRRGDTAMLGILEEGDAQATISGLTSGARSSYNRVCAEFILEQMGSVTLDDQSMQIVFETAPYTGPFTVRYCFTEKGQSDYVGMAALYRSYLFGDKPTQGEGSLPTYLQLLGSVDKRKRFLCFTYYGTEILTDYEAAEEIVRQLTQAGVKGLQVRYSGLLYGGLRHTTALRPACNKHLGSSAQLAELEQTLRDAGGQLFADVSIVQVHQTGKGFRYGRDGARYLSQQPIRLFNYSPVTHQAITENVYLKGIPYDFVLSASRYKKAAQQLTAFLQKQEVDGLYLEDLGTLLISDQKEKNAQNREKVLDLSLSAMETLQQPLLSNGGNARVLPLVEGVLNVPTVSSGYHQTDRTIPFYQIVMHGYVNYAGEAINLSDDAEDSFLKAIETGSSLQFCVMDAPAAALKNTAYTGYFSVEYAVWQQRIQEMSLQADAALSLCRGEVITAHEQLTETVTCTTYENGRRIYVNYGAQDASVEHGTWHVTVPARSFCAQG